MEERRVSERRAGGPDPREVERRIADRRSMPLEVRVEALEEMAIAYAEQAAVEDRLASGVERLGGEVGGLNSILTKVDEQQQELRRISAVANEAKSESTLANRSAEAAALDAEATAATAVIERKLFLRRLYYIAGTVLVLMLVTVVSGAWLTDRHLQECQISGPNTEWQRKVCNITFPGHDHPTDRSLEALLRSGAQRQYEQALNSRKGCERNLVRTQSAIDRETRLAQASDNPVIKSIHLETVRSLRATLVDCVTAFPVPSPPGQR